MMYVSEAPRATNGGKKGAVMMKMKGDWNKGREAVELLQLIYRMHDRKSDLPLTLNPNPKDQKPSNPLLTPWADGGGRGARETRKSREVPTGTGGVCTTFEED